MYAVEESFVCVFMLHTQTQNPVRSVKKKFNLFENFLREFQSNVNSGCPHEP